MGLYSNSQKETRHSKSQGKLQERFLFNRPLAEVPFNGFFLCLYSQIFRPYIHICFQTLTINPSKNLSFSRTKRTAARGLILFTARVTIIRNN